MNILESSLLYVNYKKFIYLGVLFMADFIDFISKEAGNRETGKKFSELLKKGDPVELKNFFDSIDYTGVSIDDCKTLINNRQNIINSIETNLKDY